ncbi:MAG TPA: RagB/SusD family nutrient uptake outer membrane protein [Bacteroidales bacterium]|nr:RagB/SusD family nutrient uptake outer membrane protein [Bacteroidales bacterium]
MKLRKIIYYSLAIILVLTINSCEDQFLNVLPQDKITSAIFPQNESDIKLLLNGVYGQLREKNIWKEGFYGFGVLDGATPNAYNFGNTAIDLIGRGALNSGKGQTLRNIWRISFSIIYRANYLLEAIDNLDLSDDIKSVYIGEAHFLRGLAYAKLVECYGGVPIILSSISVDEAMNIARSSSEETWNQVITDYDIAIANLQVNAPSVGRATKGSALGMEMRAYLYQKKYDKVLEVANQIDVLGKYSLFPSYHGLFTLANENNQEVLFDIQYMSGENSQGNSHDQECGTGTGSWIRGSRYVPTQDLVDAYEKIDGSPGKYSESNIDLDNPYQGWDPRLEFTVVVPGSFILGFRFPNYIYPGGAFNHPGNRLKQFSCRKYRIDPESDLPPSGQSSLNNIVIRYADVILSRAEAIIETNGNIDEAIALINRIRTERDDVKLMPLPMGLTQDEARQKLRHERRIEFALEGLYWGDIKRWDIGKDIYPIEIRDQVGSLIETKFPNGYLEYYNLLPIPDSERALNRNLDQNPGW